MIVSCPESPVEILKVVLSQLLLSALLKNRHLFLSKYFPLFLCEMENSVWTPIDERHLWQHSPGQDLVLLSRVMSERMWQPSPSPVESYSDASDGNDDDKWPVKAIVGEEIRLDGTSRYSMLHHDWQRRSQCSSTDMKYVLIHGLPRAHPAYLPSASRYVGEVGQLAPSGWFKHHLGDGKF